MSPRRHAWGSPYRDQRLGKVQRCTRKACALERLITGTSGPGGYVSILGYHLPGAGVGPAAQRFGECPVPRPEVAS